MKFRGKKLTALALSVMMVMSPMASTVYAEETTEEAMIVNETNVETDSTEAAVENKDVAVMSVETVAEESAAAETPATAAQRSTSEAYRVMPGSVKFYYNSTEYPDYTVTYTEVHVVDGSEQYTPKQTTATVKETYDATCTEPAYIVLTVTIDDETFVSNKMVVRDSKALGHEYKEDRYVTVYPTHDLPGEGYIHKVCTVCGYEDKDVNISDNLEALGHVFDEVTYLPASNAYTELEPPTESNILVDNNGKVVLGADGLPQLADPTKDGYYDIVKFCESYGKTDAQGHVDQGIQIVKENVLIYATKGVYAKVTSQDKIETTLVGLSYSENASTFKTENIELKDCTVAGTYVVTYYNNNDRPISQKTITVPAHHMETKAIEFNTKRDAQQCTVNGLTVRNNSCYLDITYYEVTHCTAKGCPNKACKTDSNGEHYTCPVTGTYNGETRTLHEVSRVEKVAEPEGLHLYNREIKAQIEAMDKAGTLTVDWLKTEEKKADNYIKILSDTATCEEDGIVTVGYVCKICKQVVETGEYKSPAKGHIWTPAVAEEGSLVMPTCTSTGSYNAVIYCGRVFDNKEVCGAELYRRDNVTIPRIKHTNETAVTEHGVGTPDKITDNGAQLEFLGDLVIDVQGSLLTSKSAAAYKNVVSQIVPTYGEEYAVLSQAYTLCTVCGGNKVVLDSCDELKEQLGNVNPVITVDSVTKQGKDCQPGSITLTATYTKNDGSKISATGTFTYYSTMDAYHGRTAHDPKAAVKENVVEATATTAGSYDNVIYCGTCGTELSRETITVPATGNVVLPAVTGLTATVTSTGRVSLSWNAIEGADGYIILGLNDYRTGTQIGYTTGRTTWADTQADADNWNYYWVVAYRKNTAGKNVVGELGSYVYALARVVAGAGRVTAVAGEEGIELSWAAISGANSYVIKSKTGSNAAAFNADITTDGTTYTDTTAVSGEPTFYWVYGVYKNAEGKVYAAGATSPYAWAVAE